jgi:hypothetical protein
MATIHGIACSFIHGEIPSIRMRTEIWSVPGIHGVGAQKLGYGGAPFQIKAVFFGLAVNINTWLTSLTLRVGEIGTITTAVGTYANCLIVDIGPQQVTAAYPYYLRCEVDIAGVRCP